VLHYAVQNYNADPTRVAAVGYGEYRPLVGNQTEEGRALNRRVVITVGPRSNPPRAMP
jgi:chemotaxis protein MotB